jgi:hypothetical protein
MKCAIVDGSSNGAQHAEPAHVARALGEQRLLGLTHLCDPREYENIRGPFRGTDDVGRRSPGESTCELPKKPPSRMTDREQVGCHCEPRQCEDQGRRHSLGPLT